MRWMDGEEEEITWENFFLFQSPKKFLSVSLQKFAIAKTINQWGEQKRERERERIYHLYTHFKIVSKVSGSVDSTKMIDEDAQING